LVTFALHAEEGKAWKNIPSSPQKNIPSSLEGREKLEKNIPSPPSTGERARERGQPAPA
jgi:hypothetical protein